MDGNTAKASSDWLSAAVGLAQRNPGRVLAGILVAHVVLWTLLPIPQSPNLQLDLAEGLALGREWQLGYWKHPPLPWLLTDLIYRLVGHIYAVYALGPLAVAVCLLGVYFLARDMVGPVQALIPVLALEGIHYYNFSAVKFAHDQMQLPVWAWAAFFLYRALTRGNVIYWICVGVMVALAFWAKYSALVFSLSLGLFLLLDPLARRAWRTPGPYVMALAFAAALAPHLVWLAKHVDNQFISPFAYAELRARDAKSLAEFVAFPLRWIGGQLFFVLPALGLMALAYGRRPAIHADDTRAFARRFVTTLAFGPFLLVTLSSLFTGRLAVLLWGYPLWSFLPLAIMLWFGPVTEHARQRAFAAGFIAVFVAMAALYAAVPVVESTFRNRTMAVHFPGRLAADYFTKVWREKTGTPLTYIAGGELVVNSIAVYAADQPHVIVHGFPGRSPWIDMEDVRRKGVLILWSEDARGSAFVPYWEKIFGFTDTKDAAVIELPLQTPRPKTVHLRYVIIPPRP